MKNPTRTPLPFKSEFGEGRAHIVSDGQDIATICRMHGDKSAQMEFDLAAYIAHACNAYPRLVSALRDARMRLWQWDSHPSSRAVPEIDALLRELGEE